MPPAESGQIGSAIRLAFLLAVLMAFDRRGDGRTVADQVLHHG